MNKSFIVERDVLTQVWVKQKFTVDAEDKDAAINKIRRAPREDVYCMFEHTSEIQINCPTRTLTEEFEGVGEKHHIVCDTTGVVFENNKAIIY